MNNASRCLTSAALLGGARKVQIEHEGAVYTLHLTRQGKLLLTK
jgi:hemin uptake protein HemP